MEIIELLKNLIAEAPSLVIKFQKALGSDSQYNTN